MLRQFIIVTVAIAALGISFAPTSTLAAHYGHGGYRGGYHGGGGWGYYGGGFAAGAILGGLLAAPYYTELLGTTTGLHRRMRWATACNGSSPYDPRTGTYLG